MSASFSFDGGEARRGGRVRPKKRPPPSPTSGSCSPFEPPPTPAPPRWTSPSGSRPAPGLDGPRSAGYAHVLLGSATRRA